jgi:hypothetical protein
MSATHPRIASSQSTTISLRRRALSEFAWLVMGWCAAETGILVISILVRSGG